MKKRWVYVLSVLLIAALTAMGATAELDVNADLSVGEEEIGILTDAPELSDEALEITDEVPEALISGDEGIELDIDAVDAAVLAQDGAEEPTSVTEDQLTTNAADIAIDAAHFPDAIFRAYISEKIDTDGNGYLSGEEIETVTVIDFDDYEGSDDIYDLTGIGYFKNLEKLNCGYTKMTKLDVSMCDKLEDLYCSFGKLTVLKVGSGITELSCFSNNIKKLDVSKCTSLRSLECHTNRITSLDLRNATSLEDVSCFSNKLTSLKFGKCRNLTSIECSYNRLTTLDVSKCGRLRVLKCGSNRLKKLTLGVNSVIEDLDCFGNKLASLDIGGCPILKDAVTPIIGIHNWSQSKDAVSWGMYDRWYDENPYESSIQIDKSTTLKSGKAVLYKPGTPKKIKFTKSSKSLKKGKYVNLGKYIKLSPAGVASVCKLSSSNKKIVRVLNSGYAYGVKKGTATVTVKTANGKKAKIKIKVV